jgi:hypothetical protein
MKFNAERKLEILVTKIENALKDILTLFSKVISHIPEKEKKVVKKASKRVAKSKRVKK